MAALKNIWEVSYQLTLPIAMALEDRLKGTKAIDLMSNLVLV